MRAIRICLTRPQIFRTQLRALYRASVHGNLAIMFPMITSLEEVRQVKEICRQVRQELQEAGVPFRAETPLGIMIETPAAALISDRLAPEVDFFQHWYQRPDPVYAGGGPAKWFHRRFLQPPIMRQCFA